MIACRPLEASDDLSSFCSGNDALDAWVKRNGHKNQRKYGTTHVAVDEGVIVGFVTVSPSSIAKSHLRRGGDGPEWWPVLLLGRMAAIKDRQRTGIGALLMRQVFVLAMRQHIELGCSAIIVDAKPEAIGFYKKYMFKNTRPIEGVAPNTGLTRMFLPIEVVVRGARLGDNSVEDGSDPVVATGSD